MNVQYPLREKRKLQSRADLVGAAIDLFANQGFEETTLEAVAEKAGLHVQTLYRHFPTKIDLVAAIWSESFSAFESFFSARTGDALSAWSDWVEKRATIVTRRGNAEYRKNIAEFWAYPTVSTITLKFWYRYEEVLAEGIAKDMGVDVDNDPLPTLIACMLWGGNMHAVRNWADAGGKTSLTATALKVVDTVRDQFKRQLKGHPIR
jgi:AcrR family transcriptional regulator